MRGAILIVALLLSGGMALAHDAAAAQPAPGKKAEQAAGKKTVCVITEAAQRFQLKKIGLMVFGNEEKTIRVTDWKLEDKINAKVKSVIGAAYQVKTISPSYELFQPLHEPHSLFDAPRDSLETMVKKTAAGSSCDYYLAITCGGSQFSNTNQYIRGLGVLETGTETFGLYHHLFALTYLQLYDGKTFEVLKSERGRSKEGFFFVAIRGPSQEIDVKAHPTLQAVADDPKTRDIIWSLLDYSLGATLPEMFGLDDPKQALSGPQKPKSKEDWAPF
jgi:hypothetical protein